MVESRIQRMHYAIIFLLIQLTYFEMFIGVYNDGIKEDTKRFSSRGQSQKLYSGVYHGVNLQYKLSAHSLHPVVGKQAFQSSQNIECCPRKSY